MKEYKTLRSFYWAVRHEFYPVLTAVNRLHELRRLIAWADGKKLVKPQRLYENRLRDVETRLLRERVEHPHLVSLANLIHVITYGVFPPPEYHHRGAASGYSFKRR